MEEQSIFSLSVDEAGKNHLKEAAKWARLFSILGMVLVGFMVIASIRTVTLLVRFGYSGPGGHRSSLGSYAGIWFIQTIFAFIVPVIAFFAFFFPFGLLIKWGRRLRQMIRPY